MSLDLIADPAVDAAPISPGIDAMLNFAVRTGEKPYSYAGPPPEGVPQERGEFRPQSVRIRNARLIADRPSLDAEGFALVRHETAVEDLFDEAQTLAIGHPETAALVREVTGASRVVVFDHTVRKREGGSNERLQGQARPPAARVHVDQMIWSGPQRVRQVMGRQAEALLARRAAIINVWRPIGYAARDWPLALGDARSVGADDLIASDLIFPNRRGETYRVASSPDQRWFYVPDLAPDEAILIKCWDSEESVARFTPHAGFEDPTTPPGTPPRQSIEYRTIAFFD